MTNHTVNYGRYKSVKFNDLISEIIRRGDKQYMKWSISNAHKFQPDHQIHRVVRVFEDYLENIDNIKISSSSDNSDCKKHVFRNRENVDVDLMIDKLIHRISKVTITSEKVVIEVVKKVTDDF